MTSINDDLEPGNGRRGTTEPRYPRDDYRTTEFRDDMHKDPGELEREADRARASIESTLEALERRLSPGELLDQMLNVVKDNGGAFGKNLATQVRNNPVPVLLTGIGMTWLMAASDRPPRRATASYGGAGYGTSTYGMGTGSYSGTSQGSSMGASLREGASSLSEGASSAAEAARGTLSRAGDTARTTAAHARDAAQGITGGAREGAMYARDSAMNAAHGLAETTRSGAESLVGGYEYLRREQPLVLGALAVAAGALLGSLMPATRAENRLMGEYSEEATQRLKEEGQRRVEQARRAAADAAEAARESVQPKRAGRTDSSDSESGSGGSSGSSSSSGSGSSF